MEYEAGEYRKLAVKQFPARSIRETAEGKYWKQFKAPVFAKQFGPISHIDFCQVYPYSFAVTASTRVLIYDGLSRQVKRTIGRFKDVAYSGSFRQDGKLLVAGGQNGIVQVFDVNSRSVLRQLKGHQRPVHVTRFAPDKTHVMSGSDDVTLRLWDISSGKQVLRLTGHEDYVRAAAVSPSSSDTWASGGYDHTVKLWDVRSKSCTMSFDHGAPVEDLTYFPSGGLLVSVGGTNLCVWDLLSGGKLLRRLTNFQKTISCVRLSPLAGPDSAAAPRMLAGSLDGHLDEPSGDDIASLPPWSTYTGCRGVYCHVQDTDDPSLPRLAAALGHLTQFWPRVSEMAMIVQKPSDINPAVRQANDAVLFKLHMLKDMKRLRHLQLYKTSPLVHDAVPLAYLTQLTSLILADSSYIPGPAAMLAVDLWPLTALTNLSFLGLAGICPTKAPIGLVDGLSTSTGGGPNQPLTPGCLPTSLTSLVLKQYDDLGLRMWLPHLPNLVQLKILELHNYQEPSNSPAYRSYPVPYLRFIAQTLPGLTDFVASVDARDEIGRRFPTGACSLSQSLSKLQQIRTLDFRYCQVTVDDTAQWHLLHNLPALTALRGLHATCLPPVNNAVPFQMPELCELHLSTARLWDAGRGFSLRESFPNLNDFAIDVETSRQWLSIAPCIAKCTDLTRLDVSLWFIADTESIKALCGLGASLKQLKGLDLRWSGGTARWPLPDLSTFSHLESLQLRLLKVDAPLRFRYNPDAVGDTQVLAYLAPLRQLEVLVLWGFTAMTPAVLLGIQALVPQLSVCVLVHCDRELLMSELVADWEGSDIQVVRAALRKDIELEVLWDLKQYDRRYQELPCEVEYVEQHRFRF